MNEKLKQKQYIPTTNSLFFILKSKSENKIESKCLNRYETVSRQQTAAGNKNVVYKMKTDKSE